MLNFKEEIVERFSGQGWIDMLEEQRWEKIKDDLNAIKTLCNEDIESIADVLEERFKQDERWGGPSADDGNSLFYWLSYVNRHIGQLSDYKTSSDEYYQICCEIAALTIAMMNFIRRNSPQNLEETFEKSSTLPESRL